MDHSQGFDDQQARTHVPGHGGQCPGTPPTETGPSSPQEPPRGRLARRLLAGGAALVLGGGLLVGGRVLAPADGPTTASVVVPGTTSGSAPVLEVPAPGGGGAQRWGGWGGTRNGGSGSSSATLEATTASAEQQAGLVIIETTLGYQEAAAAGTGIVLTSDGVVLTNNHVVSGSTEVQVTLGENGETYPARVVGTDATHDVAVLQLDDASGLTTAAIDQDGSLAIGDAVTAVGNAEGGGELLAAPGVVSALEETITTQDEGTTAGRTLDGLIEIDADVVAGDSGGAVYDADGEVVGMTTAASSGAAAITGYAIPVADALDIAAQILAGDESGTVSIGYPAFLGVQLGTSSSTMQVLPGGPGASPQRGTTPAGATIAGVIDGTPAAGTGLAAGDTITAVDGTAVGSSDALSQTLSGYDPGDTVTLTWTSAADGTTQTADVTLAEGPAA
ncbi:S1C family serine protease [Cellulomonas sp. P22]|uniref:S1C family serine protease n=1 Tax=Cellulomonas sp. P22 TaxID=3373189 RepID=UPI003787A012